MASGSNPLIRWNWARAWPSSKATADLASVADSAHAQRHPRRVAEDHVRMLVPTPLI
jgi:hypothetical protein